MNGQLAAKQVHPKIPDVFAVYDDGVTLAFLLEFWGEYAVYSSDHMQEVVRGLYPSIPAALEAIEAFLS